MVGPIILGVKDKPPLQIILCLSPERTHEQGGCDETKMCSRRFVFLVIEHYCSLVDVLGKREYLASCTIYSPPTKRGWCGGCFFLLQEFIYRISVGSYGGSEAELEGLNGCL